MELQQLEIGERGAGSMGEDQPDALRAGRIGRARPHRGAAAGRDHDGACAEHALVVADEPGAALVAAPQRACARVLEHGDARLLGDERGELAHDAPSGRAAAGVHDAPDRVPALEPERELPVGVGVEAHAERLQVAHARGRLAREHGGGRLAHERAPGADGVLQVQLDAVVVGERSGEAALRPVARGLRERRSGDEHDRSAVARGAERRVEACGAGADDGYVGLVRDRGCGRGHRENRISRERRERRSRRVATWSGTISSTVGWRPGALLLARLASAS